MITVRTYWTKKVTLLPDFFTKNKILIETRLVHFKHNANSLYYQHLTNALLKCLIKVLDVGNEVFCFM